MMKIFGGEGREGLEDAMASGTAVSKALVGGIELAAPTATEPQAESFGEFITHTLTANPNTVPHNLGRQARGALVIRGESVTGSYACTATSATSITFSHSGATVGDVVLVWVV